MAISDRSRADRERPALLIHRTWLATAKKPAASRLLRTLARLNDLTRRLFVRRSRGSVCVRWRHENLGTAFDRSSEALGDASNAMPRYPGVALRSGWEGDVELELRTSEGGSVERVAVVQTSGYAILDTAAREAVRAWHFGLSPSASNGRGGQVRLVVRFSLSNG